MRQVKTVRRGYVLRIQSPGLFRLHRTDDDWHSVNGTLSVNTVICVDFVDIPPARISKETSGSLSFI